MKLDYHGNQVTVNVIGQFEFNNKNYAVCTYINNQTQKIVIVETYTDENGLQTRNIPKEELNSVLEHFNSIKQKIMEDSHE